MHFIAGALPNGRELNGSLLGRRRGTDPVVAVSECQWVWLLLVYCTVREACWMDHTNNT